MMSQRWMRVWMRVMVGMSLLWVACMEPMPLYAELGPLKRRVEAVPVAQEPAPATQGALGQASPRAQAAETREEAGDEPGEETAAEGVKRAAGANERGDEAAVGVVNVNTASEEELERLPGVGPKMAARIVEAREKRRFSRPNQLRRVKGIGPKKWAKMAGYVVVEGETTLRR